MSELCWYHKKSYEAFPSHFLKLVLILYECLLEFINGTIRNFLCVELDYEFTISFLVFVFVKL